MQSRLESGTSEPCDLQQILLASQNSRRLEDMIQRSQGHIERVPSGLNGGDVSPTATCVLDDMTPHNMFSLLAVLICTPDLT